MAKYDYSSNVIPVFIERKEEEIDAFATQWTAEAGNANGKNLIFDVTAYNPQADFYNAEFVAEIQLNSTGETVLAAQDTVLINNFFPKLFSRITQQFSEVQPKSIRENTANLILFKTAGDSFDKVYKDMVKEVMENKNDFKILANRIWRNKHSYVYINKIDDIITNNIFEVKNE